MQKKKCQAKGRDKIRGHKMCQQQAHIIPPVTQMDEDEDGIDPTTSVGNNMFGYNFDLAIAAFTHQAKMAVADATPPPFQSPICGIAEGVEHDEPKVELVNRDLWEEFHRHVNEMIISKSGRRLFPALKVQLSGLDKTANYYVIMDICASDSNLWKFDNSRWSVAGKANPEGMKPLHIHPDSPASGEHWMNSGATFHRLKVTNNIMIGRTDYIVLNAMHKYRPRIHVVRSDDISMEVDNWTIVSFPETEFIAVAAYQNNEIYELKIEHNPFAKGFRDTGAGKRVKSRPLLNSSDNLMMM